MRAGEQGRRFAVAASEVHAPWPNTARVEQSAAAAESLRSQAMDLVKLVQQFRLAGSSVNATATGRDEKTLSGAPRALGMSTPAYG
ncbi:hypothetical protein T5B8_12683 [Salinisphaera sp. T5B8]